MESLTQAFTAFDQWLFLKINQGLAHPVLDPFFLFLTDGHRNKVYMGFVLIAFVAACLWKFKANFWRAVLLLAVSVSLADVICYRVIKQSVSRQRPFQSESFGPQVRKIGHAHGNSFPSNHAANTFAGASTLSYLFPTFSYFFYAYAALVALSRVYAGVHYPMDIIFGALLGLFVAISIRRLFRNQLKCFTRPKS